MEWNRLKMVGVQLIWAVALGIACLNLLHYVVVAIISRIANYEPNRTNGTRTWIVIFVCLFVYIWANATGNHLITERSRIIGSVTEGLITDALRNEQSWREISK